MVPRRAVLAFIAFAAPTWSCSPAPQPALSSAQTARPDAQASPPPPAAPDASTSDSGTAPAPPATAVVVKPRPLPKEPARLVPLESTCNGRDEDGDGHADMLVPTGANACTTNAKGACARGWLECQHGQTVCDTPPPTPEVADGIDNDCNGVVDDVPPARVHPRAFVLGPKYMWRDAKAEIASVRTVLEQAGVPYDVQPPGTDWAVQGTFARYSLLIIPGYLESSVIDAATTAALESFALGGGVIFIMKPMKTMRLRASLDLAGLRDSTRTKLATSIRFGTHFSAALRSIDSPEERVIPLTRDPERAPMDVWLLEPDGKTEVLADAYAGDHPLGPIATRRQVGRGAIYAWGHDLSTFDVTRCYVNCFEPSGDVLRLLLRDAVVEGAAGHVVLKHPMPGPQDSALLLTHDVDARDTYSSGAWGAPGALQMAAMEKKNDAPATYYFATDYTRGAFAPSVVEALCQQGFCPVGASSVRRPRPFGQLPRGTCTETRDTYGASTAPTVCGEVRVSLELLAKVMQQPPRAWRSPYLATNPFLFDVLADAGMTIDSGFGVGDLKYNLPVDTARTPKLQRLFHNRELLEFPIAGMDAEDNLTARYMELQQKTLPWFANAWEYTLLRNAANASITTIAVRPSRGHGNNDDNLGVKIGAAEHLIQVARAHGITVDSLTHFGAFWRARSKVLFDAEYDPLAGYRGSIDVGDEPIDDLTLEFGDELASFECAACGSTEIHKNRVVLRGRLEAGASATFIATPRALPAPSASGKPGEPAGGAPPSEGD